MITIKVEDFEQTFQEYLDRVEAGETIVLTRKGKPVAEIMPKIQDMEGLRPYGLCLNDFVTPEDFNDPLPAELLNAFEGK